MRKIGYALALMASCLVIAFALTLPAAALQSDDQGISVDMIRAMDADRNGWITQ